MYCKLDELAKLYCKLDEFAKLDKLIVVSWMSSLAKLYCKLDEFAKLRMSSMSWINCTVVR